MKMTDFEKLSLVREIIRDFWESSNVSEDSAVALLNAITVVAHFEEKEEENAEN